MPDTKSHYIMIARIKLHKRIIRAINLYYENSFSNVSGPAIPSTPMSSFC